MERAIVALKTELVRRAFAEPDKPLDLDWEDYQEISRVITAIQSWQAFAQALTARAGVARLEQLEAFNRREQANWETVLELDKTLLLFATFAAVELAGPWLWVRAGGALPAEIEAATLALRTGQLYVRLAPQAGRLGYHVARWRDLPLDLWRLLYGTASRLPVGYRNYQRLLTFLAFELYSEAATGDARYFGDEEVAAARRWRSHAWNAFYSVSGRLLWWVPGAILHVLSEAYLGRERVLVERR